MKKFSKVAVLLLAVIALTVLLTACNSAPGFLKKPDSDPAKLEQAFKDDKWLATKSTSALLLPGKNMVAMVSGVKGEGSILTAKSGDKIELESALVCYFKDASDAKAYYKDVKSDMKDKNNADKKEYKDDDKYKNVKVSYSFKQHDKTVILYTKISYKVK